MIRLAFAAILGEYLCVKIHCRAQQAGMKIIFLYESAAMPMPRRIPDFDLISGAKIHSTNVEKLDFKEHPPSKENFSYRSSRTQFFMKLRTCLHLTNAIMKNLPP
jgi:hypothetical protein